MRVLILILLFAFSTCCQAQKVYKCGSPAGVVVFSQTPCGKDATEVDAAPRVKPQAPSASISEISDSVKMSQIGINCANSRTNIARSYDVQLASIDRSVRDLRVSKRYSNNNLAGATRDQSIETQIQTLELRRSGIVQSMNQALADVDRRCDADREAELKRQAEARAASK
jgi:hypothetical protein